MRSVYVVGFLLALLPALAWAGVPQMYKWTDAAGVLHFSDQPPPASVTGVQTQDIPQFPPVDQAKLAAEQKAMSTQLAALQKLLNAQATQQAQARAAALAVQKAELEAELVSLRKQDQEREAVPLIYSVSRFVPRAFRTNLYVYHHPLPPASMPRPGPLARP